MKPRLAAILVIAFIMASEPTLAMEVSLWPSAELDELYSSNVGVSASNPRGDWITAQLLGGKVQASSPHRDFFLTYSTVLAEYASYSNFDSFARDHNLQLNDTEHLSNSATLNVSDSFLRGNAASGQFYTNGTQPISPQMASALLYNSTTESNSFSASFSYVNRGMLAWSSEVHQLFFSANSGSINSNSTAAAGLSFDQGGSFGVDRLLGERFRIGFGYQFDDFRFNNGVPSTDTHMPMLRLSWGTETPISLQVSAGPRIVSTSSGVIGTTLSAASTTVQPGFQLAASYTGERFNLQATGGESSGISAGFGGQTNNFTASTLFQYELTRRAVLFANFGYLDFSGSGTNGYSLSYAAGASYRLTRLISLTARYYGYRTLVNGATVGSLVGTPGQTSVNVFLFGVVFQAPPWKWVLD